MTPKEKSKELVWKYYHLFSVELENTIDYREAKQCEKIADDYAIEFAEWLFDVSRIGTTKELLEIFKKEKGL